MRSPPETPVCEPQLRALLEWFAAHGGSTEALGLEIRDGLRGGWALRDIDDGDHLLYVPKGLMMKVSDGKATRLGRLVGEGAPALSAVTWLALVVLETRRDGGFWKHHVDAMPPVHRDLPMFWPKTDWALLDGSAARWHALHLYRHLRAQYRLLGRALPAGARPTLREFASAWCAVKTRCHDVVLDGEKTTVVVPLADMLNHDSASGVLAEGDITNGFRYMLSGRLSAGQPVTFCYGRRSNAELLARYGFALEDNPHDHALLYVDLRRDPDGASALGRGLLGRSMESADTRLLFSWLRLWLDGRTPAAPVAGRPAPHQAPIDRRNEREVLRRLNDACGAALAAFLVSPRRNEQLLPMPELSWRARFADWTCRGEKRLLVSYMNLCETSLRVLREGLHCPGQPCELAMPADAPRYLEELKLALRR